MVRAGRSSGLACRVQRRRAQQFAGRERRATQYRFGSGLGAGYSAEHGPAWMVDGKGAMDAPEPLDQGSQPALTKHTSGGETMPSVIILCGSPRKGGNTDVMADAFARGAEAAGATVEKVYLDDLWIRPIAEVCDEPPMRVDLRQDDDARKLLDRVLAADVVLFASPVYWQGVSGQMKCFVDRWSCYWGQEWFKEGMRGKVFAAVTAHAAPDPEEAQWVLRAVQVWAAFLSARYAGGVGFQGRDKGAVAGCPDILAECEELGRRAVEMSKAGER